MQNQEQKFTSIGGQAVIEGVMMKSPRFLAVAVRLPNKKIKIKSQSYSSWAKKYPIIKKPFLRGVLMLIESMVHGIEALSFSASQASVQDTPEAAPQLTNAAIAGSILIAFLMGMGLFVALPHFLTALVTTDLSSPWFHALDGLIKMVILILYVYLISLMKDVKRVFQYHGAEHQSIYAFEQALPLEVQNVQIQSTLHPRCGTSFLLFLVLVSIIIFSALVPLIGLSSWQGPVVIKHLLTVLLKIVLMLPVAGISYEIIKYSAQKKGSWFFDGLVWPGLMLQNITTKKPDADQIEVALASLRQVLWLEKNIAQDNSSWSEEKEIQSPLEVPAVSAQVEDFPEGHLK